MRRNRTKFPKGHWKESKKITDYLLLMELTSNERNSSTMLSDPSPPPADPSVNATVQKLVQAAEQVGLPYDFSTLSAYVSSGSVGFSHPGTLRIHESTCSWNQYYPVLTFLFSGQLYADYIERTPDLLRQTVQRGDAKKWWVLPDTGPLLQQYLSYHQRFQIR